ncbi:MAG: lipocalin family protein [Pseudomonadales bacterium]
MPPIRTEKSVDLDRFAGDWYVIANIPTFVETDAYNAVENYAEPVRGRIATTFTFNKGGFDGEKKTYRPTGFVREGTGNAVWGMQFIWPIRMEYRILYVDEQYAFTIIGRTKRDYVWIMARQPFIDETDYQRLVSIVEQEGYDIAELRRVPHRSAEVQGLPP